MSAHPRGVVVLSFVGALLTGVGVAVQTSANGHLSVILGSPVASTAFNHGSALVAGLVIAAVSGAFPKAWRRFRQNRAQFRWWWLLGGLMGFAGTLMIIIAAPIIGVVAVAVGLTFGQLAGSVITDSGGFGPGGRRPLGLLRFLGLAVAVIAILVGSIGRFEFGNVVVLLLLVVAGILIAFQQAANGWWVIATGEWSVMLVINFLVSGVAVGAAVLVTSSLQPIHWAATPWWAWVGGIIGVINTVIMAYTVRYIGLLSSMLGVAAGQAVTSIVADLIVPVDAIGVTIWSAVAALLAVVAVALAGLGSVRRSRATGAQADRDAQADHPAAVDEG